MAAHEELGIYWVPCQFPACLADAGGQLVDNLGVLDGMMLNRVPPNAIQLWLGAAIGGELV